jgi:hypothetical protein
VGRLLVIWSSVAAVAAVAAAPPLEEIGVAAS